MKFLNKNSAFFAIIAVVFLAVLMIIFKDFAFDPNKLMLNSDQLNSIGSRILRAQNAVLTEWDDSRLGGVPTIDALFGDAYHPLVWAQFLTDPARAVGFKFILTLWVAFMSAMALTWSLTGNKWWGTLLGFLYALSPEFFTYIYGGHDGKMMVFAIAPLALLAIRKVVSSGSIPYMVVLALSVTWMILGSHLQLTYLFLWGAGLYALYEVFFRCYGVGTRCSRLAMAAVGLAFGLAISSFQLVPPYLYTTTQSVRGDSEHTNYGHAVSWSLHQEEMAQMLLPGFVGVDVYEQDPQSGDLKGSSFVNVTMSEYRQMMEAGRQGSPFYWGHNSFKLDHNNAGALLTFLGFLCLFIPGVRRWAIFWGMGAVIALSYGMGDHSPFFKLWYSILPGVKNFRAPGMALFWLPLILIMMSAPVLRTISSTSENSVRKQRALLHGAAMYAILLVLAVIARYYWTSFITPLGFVVLLAFAVACLGVMSIDDQGKEFSFANFVEAFKSGLPGTHRAIQVFVILGFSIIGVFMMSGQNLLNDPVTAPYFKPLNETVMNMTAGKVIPGFILILVIMAITLFVFKWKGNTATKAAILIAAAGVELFFIDGAFVQNVEASEYLQPGNAVVRTIKAPYQGDSINVPRVLSLSRNKALSGNCFPQYNMRNADGIHDNELASYRAFRGGQNNSNYLLNINTPDAPHPFLDLMNVGAIIFDSRQGTTYMPIPTAMGEASLYGEAVVMTDEQAIETLKKKAAIRKPKPVEKAQSAAEASVDSTKSDSEKAASAENAKAGQGDNKAEAQGAQTAEKADAQDAGKAEAQTAENAVAEAQADDPNVFYYREKLILSEAPEKKGDGGVPQGYAKLVERNKMDTQVFQVESDRAGFMLVAGNYHPYWQATVNGAPAKVYKAFGTLRAVEIPKGKSEVRMEFRSTPFHNCLKVSLIAAAVLALVGVAALLLKKKN